MEIIVQREPSKKAATLGRLYVDGLAFCDTLEDEIREVPGAPVTEWKVHGKTAIPQGRYRVTLEPSPRFGPNTITLHDVPGFSYIRAHAGNDADDTEGCLLVGVRNSDATIANSKVTLTQLKIKILTALQKGEAVLIEYQNPQVSL